MTSASQRPLLDRLLMAVVALLFLLQPLANAGGCALRAKLLGRSCCCAQPEQKPSCCSKREQHESPKRCDCKLSAPPLVPPSGTAELPNFLGELARALDVPALAPLQTELAPSAPRAHAPPGFGSCFHTLLGAGMSRALAFERTLRC